MTNFNGLPILDQDGGKTLEKANENEEESNFSKDQKIQWERFNIAISARLDALVKEGKCPERWTNMTKESVQTITNVNLDPKTIAKRERGELPSSFFPDNNPEQYAVQFAEIGLESILEFRKQTDSARYATLANIIPVVEQADEILMSQNREDDSLAQKEKLEKIKSIVSALKEKIKIFNQKIEEIKDLRFTLEDQTFDSLKNEINDLKKLLNVEKKSFDASLN